MIGRLANPATGRAAVVGFSGPPGSGKSTLIDAYIAHVRASGRSVAVAAVDPSSPISGGSILGDRVRMQRHSRGPRRLHPLYRRARPSRRPEREAFIASST